MACDTLSSEEADVQNEPETKSIPGLLASILRRALRPVVGASGAPSRGPVLHEGVSRKSMEVSRWRVFHCYTSFVIGDIDTHALAAALIRNGVCHVGMHTDGSMWWQDADGFRSGTWSLYRAGHEPSARATFPNGLRGYPAQFARETAELRFNELYLLSDSAVAELGYVRLGMGPVLVVRDGLRLPIFAQLRLFQNGVFQLLLSRESSEGLTDVQDLVVDEVNLFSNWFSRVFFPPEIMAHAVCAAVADEYPGLRHWRVRRRLLAQTRAAVKSSAENFVIDEATFELCDFGADEGACDGSETTTRMSADDVRSLLLSAVWGTAEQLLGKSFHLGNYWRSRPQTYLTEVATPSLESASQARELHSHELGLILLRVPSAPRSATLAALGPSLRPFEDFSVHVAESGGLWVFTQKASSLVPDGQSCDYLVLRCQAQAEFVDYVHVEARRLLQLASLGMSRFDYLVALRRGLRDLQRAMAEVSIFGEITDYFRAAWKHLRVDDTLQAAEKDLDLGVAVIQEASTQQSRRLGVLLSIVFGLVGAAGLSDKVARPILTQILGTTMTEPHLTIGAYGLSCLCVLGAVGVVLGLARSRPRP